MSFLFSKALWLLGLGSVVVFTLMPEPVSDTDRDETLPVSLASVTAKDPARLQMTTQRVVVFKDGYCLVVKQATATTDSNGMVYTDEVPDSAVLGSFWAVPESGEIRSMVAGWVETESTFREETDCTNLIDIIAANLGRRCSFTIGSQSYRGTLRKILPSEVSPTRDQAERESIDIARLLSSFSSVHPPDSGVEFDPISSKYFVLSTGDGEMVLPIGSVQNLMIDELNSSLMRSVSHSSKHKRITIDLDTADTEVKINLMYFRPDVRWIPTYRIELTDQEFAIEDGAKSKSIRKIAKISMQGELLNEAEDFTDVPFHLVVGVPNFRFRDIPSPMVLESTMRNALAQAAPTIMLNNNGMSNALFTQRSMESNGGSNNQAVEPSSAIAIPEEITNSGGNDLFVYQLGAMSLREGERATVPILQTDVAYRDVYTWEVDLTHAETHAASGAAATSPLVLAENNAWRQIELFNSTELPWTTGAAMFVDGYQPLAQELLTYTSPGGVCRIPVTVAVDLSTRAEDFETGRELQALQWRNHWYARVDGKIQLELRNNKSSSVAMEIRVRFGGRAKTASDEGGITRRAFRREDWHNGQGDAINNSSHVTWTRVVPAGETFQPNVDYDFFVRY